MFTLTDTIVLATDLDLAHTPTNLAAVITDGIADGMLPDEPHYHALARAAARLPRRSVSRMVARIYGEDDIISLCDWTCCDTSEGMRCYCDDCPGCRGA